MTCLKTAPVKLLHYIDMLYTRKRKQSVAPGIYICSIKKNTKPSAKVRTCF